MSSSSPRRRVYEPAVGPRLKKLLVLVFALFSLLAVNAVYLTAVRLYGHFTEESHENWFYLNMFLVHLVLGFALLIPAVIFGILHIKNARHRPNRRAVRVGYALFSTVLLMLGSGVVLTRIEGVLVVKDPQVRSISYWIHVLSPLAVAWLFILHRLAGEPIKWKIGLRWAAFAGVFAAAMLLFHAQDPRAWNVVGNDQGEKYFFPSLSRTVSGEFIPADVLQNDEYCLRCHEDAHRSWAASAHRFSSFNNPAYLTSVKEVRDLSMELDGNVNRSRWCAGCHDPVPFFGGLFSDPDYDLVHDPTAKAGITCTSCHSITHVNSTLGNADFTIDEPVHYPFATSDHPVLRWINEQLIKAKPEFHKKTFLKPLHRTTEFCSTCHKVHLPPELNDYKWLRGQNHHDAFWQSGVSGHFVGSFYYPPEAEQNCNKCHMPPLASDDFGGQVRDGIMTTLDHQFPSANTAVPLFGVEHGMLSEEEAEAAIQAHREFNEGVVRVDLFALREDGAIDGELTAPLRPTVPELVPGKRYLIDAVLRTLKVGHLFTQGTTDSNEVWLDVEMRSGDRLLGRSGGFDPDRAVDPWSHFVNVFLLDRDGNRINRRNAADIFTPLYNHQIPPGAADVVHYVFTVPDDVTEPITFKIKWQYRKFDTEFMKIVREDPEHVNTLPILTLDEDEITFPIAGASATVENAEVEFPLWQRWNDYGIGLFRHGDLGELRQAEQAFQAVEKLGRPEGPINLARVYLKEGRVTQEAPEALRRARDFDPKPYEWSLLWFTGQVNQQNGRLDEAIANYEQLVEGGFEQAIGKGYDFSKDYELLATLGVVTYERARQERGETRKAAREERLRRAASWFERTLDYDAEHLAAHYNLSLIYGELGDAELAQHHRDLHARYKPDDNARDRAVAEARMRYPAANHAAEAVKLYDLQREGAYELSDDSTRGTR